jgi:hypothetical protein
MGGWYAVGLGVGLGVALGLLAAAGVPRLAAAASAAAAAGAILGLLAFGWPEAVAGGLGGAVGALDATPLVRGTLRRGGTRGGTAALGAGAAAAAAGLAFVPALGFVEAAVLTALVLRLRRREPERYAGLRTLAR